MNTARQHIIARLRQDILRQEGYAPQKTAGAGRIGLGPVEDAFPNGAFPCGNLHEFLTFDAGQMAATNGFISGLLATLMQNDGTCIWISKSNQVFPAALSAFGIQPHRLIFTYLQRDRDVLWAAEEALKCEGLAAVIAEVGELTFMQSRRLQLAVEQSRVTGFILRSNQRKMSTTACIARWQICAAPSRQMDLPGVGYTCFNVSLLKVKNGHTGNWLLEWKKGGFVPVARAVVADATDHHPLTALKAG